jgi:hypothetical protein
MNIFEVFFKALAWLIKAPIWIVFTILRTTFYIVAFVLFLATYLLSVLFYPFISIETLRSYSKKFRQHTKSISRAFFAEIQYNEEKALKSSKSTLEKVEIGEEKKVSVDSMVVTKHSSICTACGTAFSERVKELIEQNTNQPVFCEFCGKEIVLD